jgi:hypothetical protein
MNQDKGQKHPLPDVVVLVQMSAENWARFLAASPLNENCLDSSESDRSLFMQVVAEMTNALTRMTTGKTKWQSQADLKIRAIATPGTIPTQPFFGSPN